MTAIEGFDGYFVNEEGAVFSTKGRSLRELKPQLDRHGYHKVNLHIGGKQTSHLVHRLIAEAFIPNPENKRTINHKNGVKTDNQLCNLEWNTHSENHRHAFRELGRVHPQTGKFGSDNPLSKAVIRCSLDGTEIEEYGAMMDAERDGFNQGNISYCCNGKRKTYKGFKWRYKND